ncbi:hypothetical protein QTP86_018333, partial [Hemibagrus guttatus]
MDAHNKPRHVSGRLCITLACFDKKLNQILWLARLPHTSRVGGSIPASAVCVESACSPRALGVSSGYSGFLPRSKDMHCRLIGISKI